MKQEAPDRLQLRLTARARELDVGPEPSEGDFVELTVGDVPVQLVGDPNGDTHLRAFAVSALSVAALEAFQQRAREITEGRARGYLGTPEPRDSSSLPDAATVLRTLREVGSGRLAFEQASFPDPTPGEDIIWFLHGPVVALDVTEPVRQQLRSACVRVVQILRWFFNRPLPAQPLADERYEWALDGTTWHAAPNRVPDMPSVGEPGRYLSKEAFAAVQGIVDDPSIAEPAAHQVLLEAIALQETNPRAALVLAVSAAEIGVRDATREMVGDRLSEQWLLDRRSTPSVDEFLIGYLPRLTAIRTQENDGGVVPKDLRMRLKRAVKQRHQVVHRGADPPPAHDLSLNVVAVHDLLYLLDWICGNKWALNHLTDAVRDAYEV